MFIYNSISSVRLFVCVFRISIVIPNNTCLKDISLLFIVIWTHAYIILRWFVIMNKDTHTPARIHLCVCVSSLFLFLLSSSILRFEFFMVFYYIQKTKEFVYILFTIRKFFAVNDNVTILHTLSSLKFQMNQVYSFFLVFDLHCGYKYMTVWLLAQASFNWMVFTV